MYESVPCVKRNRTMFKPLQYLIHLFFPARCLVCREYLPYDTDAPFCGGCRLYLDSLTPREIPIPAGACAYMLDYMAARRAITAYKFHNKPQYARALGKLLVPLVTALGEVDCITWAPVSALRLTKRGYDQSRLLAEAVGHTLQIPVRPMLRKRRHTRRQSQTPHDKRGENVRGAYTLAGGCTPAGLKIVLIDDVVTTGSTISECCRVLYDAGAREVFCVALAH